MRIELTLPTGTTIPCRLPHPACAWVETDVERLAGCGAGCTSASRRKDLRDRREA